MIYLRKEPSAHLSRFVECFWLMDSEGAADVMCQKIIPDGYPELIFHYGDPYKIDLSREWVLQSRQLVAGQIRRFFYLQNTGVSGMIGVKLQPAALHILYGVNMFGLQGKVADLRDILSEIKVTRPALENFDGICREIEDQLLNHQNSSGSPVEEVIKLIQEKHGMLDVGELSNQTGYSKRTLERLFKIQVGLSPKLYSRIVRLSYIFECVKEEDYSWASIAYQAGFTDQSHLIKNFKEFTGEDPSRYRFDELDMANFFLKK
jgi:AraC-like DNA-binding protein